MKTILLAAFCAAFLRAQPVDDTQLKQVIIFGRHSVRAPVAPNVILNNFSAYPFPDFGVAAGILTPKGEKLETILGGYYRQWLSKEGLLTGNDSTDANFVYFHANVIQRTIDTAQHFWAGFLPGAPVNVQYLTPSTASDPLFDPVGAGVALLDQQMAIAAVTGRLGGNPQSLASAYASEFAFARSVLFNYPANETPVPATPTGKMDVTMVPIAVTAGTNGAPVNLGGLNYAGLATDPFLMEYTDGMAASDVGWGQLNSSGMNQAQRIYNLAIELEYRTPYLDKVQSSNVASHIVRSMVQAATGKQMAGSLGSPSTKVIVLIASDVNVTGFAGLFHLDWLLPGYQQNFCAPGGAVVLQLRQSQSTGEYIIRASYVAQTLDQLRNQTALTLDAPPAISPVFIPNCSIGNATFDCSLGKFVELAKEAIDPESADVVN